jgi:hypothetical protein
MLVEILLKDGLSQTNSSTTASDTFSCVLIPSKSFVCILSNSLGKHSIQCAISH